MITYEPKVYLGDGVFVQQDSLDRLILTTENGIEETNKIILEPEILTNFDAYRGALMLIALSS